MARADGAHRRPHRDDGRPPAADAAHARPRARPGARPPASDARRDHRRAAVGPRREGLHRDARVARARPLRAVHLPPPRRGDRHLRPRQRAARRPHGRHPRAEGGRGGEDRRADARREPDQARPADRGRGERERGRRRRGRGRGRRRPSSRCATSWSATTPGASRSRCAPARSSASRRSRARGRTGCSTTWRASASRSGGEMLVAGKPHTPGHPYDAIRSGVVLVPADRMLALLPQRPIRENIATPLYNRLPRWGPINRGRREPPRVQRDRAAVDRHARAAAGAPALRRQPAEADDRALAGRGLHHHALLRPHARHRRRHQAPDLRAAARAGRGRRGGPALHHRVPGDPARLRPHDRRLPRRGDGGDAGLGGRRAGAAEGGPRAHERRRRRHDDRRRAARRSAARGPTGAASPTATAGRSASTSCSCCWSSPTSGRWPRSSSRRSTSRRSSSAACRWPSPRWRSRSSSSPAASTSRSA